MIAAARPCLSPRSLPRLLIVDDDQAILDLVAAIGAECDYAVSTTRTAIEFFAEASRSEPALVLADLRMPSVDGVELIRKLGQEKCTAKVAVLSGADARTRAAAQRLGREYGLEMLDGLSKPLDIDQLRAFLRASYGLLRGPTPQELLQALDERQLEVWYQPLVSLAGSHPPRITGAEALLRWRHPKRGVLTASRFIDLIDQEGLMEPLSSWVLAEAIGQLACWEKHGIHISASVNIPSSLLDNPRFPDHLVEALSHANTPAERLILEITERAAIADGPTAMEVLTRLRLKGVSLSIDDFGTGYSSVADLYRMPFSQLKIDASFVRDMPESAEAKTIVRTLIGMAHELGLEVCAEGVETADICNQLIEMHCDKAQGFMFGAAQPAAEFEILLLSSSSGGSDPTEIVCVRRESE
jgi:EAL domain-containing protein (putative c-di-GMP-specific phosphodiesterase class I)